MRSGSTCASRSATETSRISLPLACLEHHHDREDYLLAAVNARQAAPIIIATGNPVMALGGFSGGDPILTVDDFARPRCRTPRALCTDRQRQRRHSPGLWGGSAETADRLDPGERQEG